MASAKSTSDVLPEVSPVPANLTAYLEQKKRALRAQFTTRPLSSEECQRHEDIHWAQQDPEVQARYRGQFIVPYQRQIVAHGSDVATVLAEAARVSGRSVEELPLVGIVDPLADMPR